MSPTDLFKDTTWKMQLKSLLKRMNAQIKKGEPVRIKAKLAGLRISYKIQNPCDEIVVG